MRLNQLCSKGKSSLRQKDIENDGPFNVYGASGIVGRMDSYQNERPYVAIVKDGAGVGRAMLCEGKTSVLGTMQALLPNEGTKLSYLLHLVRSLKLGESYSGSTIPHIYFKDYGKQEVPALSADQQSAIAERLDLAEQLMALIDDETVKLDLLVKSRFVEMFGEDNWPVEPLNSVADVQGGLTKNKKREKYELQLPYLRVANVLQGELDLSEMLSIGLTEAERDKTLLQAGDILFVEGNGSKDQIGRSAIWDGSIDPCVHQNHLIRVRLSERVLPVFALAYFSSPTGREQIVAKAVSTSGLFTLSIGKIKALEIPVPPLTLQQEFAVFVRQVDKLRFILTGC